MHEANNAVSRPDSPGSDLAVLLFFVLFAVAAMTGLHAFARWSADYGVKQFELALQTGAVRDESTVVLATLDDAQGSRWVFYKLGHGDYANWLRAAGVGCRFYAGGSPFTFEKYKPTDPIPFDVVPSGTTVVGECDPSRYTDHFDLASAQK